MKARVLSQTLALSLVVSSLLMPGIAMAQGFNGPEALNRWDVPGSVTSGQDLRLGAKRVDSVQVGRDLYMNGTIVTGDVQAGRQVAAADCQVTGNIQAGRDVELRRCSSINSVSAGRNVQVVNSTVNGQIKTSGKLTAFNSDINASVYAGGGANIENTKIAGTLNVASPYVRLLNANIEHIRVIATAPANAYGLDLPAGMVNTARNSYNMRTGGNSVSTTQVSTYSNSGKSLITVGPSSVSNVNGYTVKGSVDSTTLITPDNTIYVNGHKVSGNGPELYATYVMQTTGAPNIMGPGWAATSTVTETMTTETTTTSKGGLVEGPVVELTNNSTVKGKIIFEGGMGKVIVHHGSTFDGDVEGGTIERI